MFDYAYQNETVESAQTPRGKVTGVIRRLDSKTGGRRSALGRGVERVYQKYHQVLIGYLRNRLVNKEEAEDVAQEVYYRLSRRADVPELEFPKAFVLQTAANLLVDLNRVRVRHQASHHITLEDAEETLYSQTANPEDLAQHRQTLADIDRLLGELPPKCQAVFLMHRLDGATYNEIATDLAISVSMVEKYISKALLHLRSKLEVDHG